MNERDMITFFSVKVAVKKQDKSNKKRMNNNSVLRILQKYLVRYREGKKTTKSFFKISQRLFIVQRRFVFYKILKAPKLF